MVARPHDNPENRNRQREDAEDKHQQSTPGFSGAPRRCPSSAGRRVRYAITALRAKALSVFNLIAAFLTEHVLILSYLVNEMRLPS